MRLLLRLICYLAVIGAVVGGAAAGLLILSEPDGATAPPAEARTGAAPAPAPAAVPNRIAAWQERKAEEAAYAAKVTAAAVQPVSLAAPAAEVPAAPETAPPAAERPAAEPPRRKPKSERAKPARQPHPTTALGYAPAPRSRIAYENVFNSIRDRAGN